MNNITHADPRIGGRNFGDFFVQRDAMVLLLTWAAGGVDAISYLGLGHVFTANMTGNAVLLGLAVGQGQGLAALRSIIALAGFVLGVSMGAMLMGQRPSPGEWSRAASRAVALEWIILALFTLTWHLAGRARAGEPLYPLIALSAVAMGIQSAAIRHLRVPGIATTYITGTLTSMVSGFVGWLQAKIVPSSTDNFTQPRTPSAEQKHGPRLQAAVLGIYILAAVASGFLQARGSRLVALSPPVALTLVLANTFFRR
ncbi:MAG: hypothetical protein DMG70_22680 [Acidobacteria bacterium]|nr:MAG: hypothetical protein DMG70_22680 [Acidobacteriota bacterium]PYY07235.1 MAG: hypothetical protein DMG69_20280 [Acidobacteriota bacterium]